MTGYYEAVQDQQAKRERERAEMIAALKLALSEIEGNTPFTTPAKTAIREILERVGG